MGECKRRRIGFGTAANQEKCSTGEKESWKAMGVKVKREDQADIAKVRRDLHAQLDSRGVERWSVGDKRPRSE